MPSGSWLTEPENGFMEPKYYAKEVIIIIYTPIIIWRSAIGSLGVIQISKFANMVGATPAQRNGAQFWTPRPLDKCNRNLILGLIFFSFCGG